MKSQARWLLIAVFAFAIQGCCTLEQCQKKYNCIAAPSVGKPAGWGIPSNLRIMPLATVGPRELMGKGILEQGDGMSQIANARCTSARVGEEWKALDELTEEVYGKLVKESEAALTIKDIESYSLSSGIAAKVHAYANLGFGIAYNDKLYYQLDITKQYHFQKPLAQTHAIQVEGKDRCGRARKQCGTQFVKTVYCGEVTFAKLKNAAFNVDGSVKVEIVDVDLSVDSKYVSDHGKAISGCFLYEPMDYAALEVSCQDNHYLGLMSGPVCKAAGLTAAECVKERFPAYEDSVDFAEGVKAYLEEE